MLVSSFAQRLEEALKLRNLTPAEIVRRSELLFKDDKISKPLTKPLMTNYLKGTYEAKQDNVYALSLLLNVDEAWLMGYDVEMEKNKTKEDDIFEKIGAIPISSNPDITNIPVIGTVKAGYDYLAQENIVGTVPVETSLVGDGTDFFALEVKGDSMSPVFIEKDIVIIKKQNDCENNEIAIVIVNGDEGTIKKVRKTEQGIILQPLNPAYAPLIFTNKEIKDMPVTIIGVVKQLKRTF